MVNQSVLAAAGLAATVAAGNRDILPLPPMGFNNWGRFETNINETIFIDAADAMSKNGLLAAGYNRLNLDDAWSTNSRDEQNRMVPDPAKFPKGMPWLTNYMRSKGFIPGIYSDAGHYSCGGYPGSQGYEEIDLKTFQDWGFDYLKMDGCNLDEGPNLEEIYRQTYQRWFDALAKAEKPMIFSDSAPAYFCDQKNLTDWYTVMGWAAKNGQLARHSYDVATFTQYVKNVWPSIMTNYGQQVRLARYQKPGYFNDPDYLITDHPGQSLDEKKSHMALWCSFSAPLIISVNTPTLTEEELKILTNKDLIAVNQDKLVQQATLVSQDATWDVLSKSLDNGDRLLTILNKGTTTADIKVPFQRLGLSRKALKKGGSIEYKDLWTGKTSKVAIADGGITASSVPSHGTAVFRITKPADAITPTGQIFNTYSLKCLTDDKSGKVTWKKCDASDAQVWNVRTDGHINSLLRPDECIVDVNGKLLSRHSGCHTESWTYQIGGNLVNDVSKHCLTEETDGSAMAQDCGYLTNEQVVSLPVGATVTE